MMDNSSSLEPDATKKVGDRTKADSDSGTVIDNDHEQVTDFENLQEGKERTEHCFEYHQFDEFQSVQTRSIFDFHRRNVESAGNQRPTTVSKAEGTLPQVIISQDHSPPTNVLAHRGYHFLPHLLHTVLSDTSASEDSDHNLELRPSIAKAKSEPSSPLAKKKTSTKKTKLFDYKDLACLEKSKRVRRRKRSEVDIEVGLRLSRFVSRPYEGAIDKYSNRKQTKTSLHPYAPNRGIWSEPSLSRSPLTSSNESSPVGSFDTRNFPSAYERSRQTDFTGESVASHLRGRRGARRRSVSASPPRSNLLFDSALHRQVGASHHTPPGVPPSQLRGPSSSPIISRYRRSTFKTILSSPDCEKIVHEVTTFRRESECPTGSPNCAREILCLSDSSESPKHNSSLLFPAIHGAHSEQPNKVHPPPSFNSSCPSGELTKLKAANRRSKNLRPASQMITAMNRKSSKKSPQTPSPSTQKKRVVLNTSLPVGSPTFQRAMKGFKPDETTEDSAPVKDEVGPKTSQKKGRKPRVRIASASFSRSEKKFASGKNAKPTSSSTAFNDTDEYNRAMLEIRDKLTSLGTASVEGSSRPVPIKSILKNRRRSIDDLDVGTKKGLSAYLKAKQLEGNSLLPNHFHE